MGLEIIELTVSQNSTLVLFPDPYNGRYSENLAFVSAAHGFNHVPVFGVFAHIIQPGQVEDNRIVRRLRAKSSLGATQGHHTIPLGQSLVTGSDKFKPRLL